MVIDHPGFEPDNVAKWGLWTELTSQVIAVSHAEFVQGEESQNCVLRGHPWND